MLRGIKAMSACEKGGEWTWALHLLSDFCAAGLEANAAWHAWAPPMRALVLLCLLTFPSLGSFLLLFYG